MTCDMMLPLGTGRAVPDQPGQFHYTPERCLERDGEEIGYWLLAIGHWLSGAEHLPLANRQWPIVNLKLTPGLGRETKKPLPDVPAAAGILVLIASQTAASASSPRLCGGRRGDFLAVPNEVRPTRSSMSDTTR